MKILLLLSLVGTILAICPSDKFIARHRCDKCKSVHDALQFVIEKHRWVYEDPKNSYPPKRYPQYNPISVIIGEHRNGGLGSWIRDVTKRGMCKPLNKVVVTTCVRNDRMQPAIRCHPALRCLVPHPEVSGHYNRHIVDCEQMQYN